MIARSLAAAPLTPQLSLPASDIVVGGVGIARPGARVIYMGQPGAVASDYLQIGAAYTVTWCGGYLGHIRLRLKGWQGFTFLRSLFVVVG